MFKTKVCVITIDDTKYNYGNKLQNYALINVLDQLGYEPYSLYFKKPESVIIYRIKLLCTSLNKKNYLKNRLKK